MKNYGTDANSFQSRTRINNTDSVIVNNISNLSGGSTKIISEFYNRKSPNGKDNISNTTILANDQNLTNDSSAYIKKCASNTVYEWDDGEGEKILVIMTQQHVILEMFFWLKS